MGANRWRVSPACLWHKASVSSRAFRQRWRWLAGSIFSLCWLGCWALAGVWLSPPQLQAAFGAAQPPTAPVTPTAMPLQTPVTTTLFFPQVTKRPQTRTPYLPLVTWPHPLTPYQPYPPQGAENQSPNLFFTWELLYPTDQPLTYEIAISDGSAAAQVVATGLTQRSFDPFTFAPATRYYWRVTVIDATGQRIDGPLWTFTVEPHYDPPQIGSMVAVPAGEFMMGCDATVDRCQLERELPLHRVYLDGFELDKYEVTNLEYRQCVAAGACALPRRFDSPGRSSYFGNPNYDYYPVMFVSWYDAQNYCKWAGKRLPTEAEWEKAARGPIDTRPWPWGSDGVTCDRANYYMHCIGRSSRVGSYPASTSPYGAMDMAGNVFEWVADRYDVTYYARSPYANPPGPDVSRVNDWGPPAHIAYYTIRGGSYHDNWWYARVTHRHWGHHGDEPNGDSPLFRSFRVGFRCARSIPLR